MKRVLYFDASAGVSGDMFVGALLDVGASFEGVREHLGCLGIEGFEVRARKVSRRGLVGTKFDVLDPESGHSVDALTEGGHTHEHGHDHHDDLRGGGHTHGEEHGTRHAARAHEHRGLREIRGLIGRSSLPRPVAEDALAVFDLLAWAEARVHGVPPDEIHFHEVGALDSIVDIVSAASAFHQLGAEAAWASPIHVGSGTVRCAHGVLPVPAPATLELLKGIPAYSSETQGELATPTGVALLRHFCRGFRPMPPLVVEAVGYGAGTKDFGIPNLFRVTMGRVAEKAMPVQAAQAG